MENDILEKLKNIILDFDVDNAAIVAQQAISEGIDPLKCVEALTIAIRIIGDKFGTGELFLPDLVCASEAMKKALPIITAKIEELGEKTQSLGKVIIGTVFGDIHSIGKSMVGTLLYASGFEVIDMGVNVKSTTFLDAVKEHKPDIIAMSSLLTTTMMEQKKVIDGLIEEGLRDKVKVMVGGAPVNKEFAQKIGADGYGSTAPKAVNLAKTLLGIQ